MWELVVVSLRSRSLEMSKFLELLCLSFLLFLLLFFLRYFSFLINCKNPKACTILLRGASKDVLGEIERNLQDAMFVTRNILLEPAVVPGGGAVEMAVGKHLNEKSKSLTGLKQGPYKSLARALEVVPRTLIQNCGGDTIRTLTALRAKHATTSEDNKTFGVNGETGKVADMKQLGVWEPLAVKLQAYKTAIEVSYFFLFFLKFDTNFFSFRFSL